MAHKALLDLALPLSQAHTELPYSTPVYPSHQVLPLPEIAQVFPSPELSSLTWLDLPQVPLTGLVPKETTTRMATSILLCTVTMIRLVQK